MSEKLDRRTKYTKMIIENNFIELLKQNPINKITVKTICDKADVNRSTFYKYYKDVYNLLENIEDSLYAKFKRILEGMEAISTNKVRTVDIFQLIADNKDICKIILGENGDANFIKKIIMLGNISYKINIDTKLSDKSYIFVSSGSVGVIQDWINNGLKESPVYISQIIDKLTYNVFQN